MARAFARSVLMVSAATVSVLFGSIPADAQTPPRLLGCEITIDLNATYQCLTNAVNREVKKAETNARAQFEQLPNVARLDWEREVLRQLRVQSAVFNCLEQAPAFDFVATVQRAAANPSAFAQAQLRTSMAQVRTQWSVLIKPELDAIAAGRVPSISPGAAFATGHARVTQVTRAIPGARCLFPSLPPAAQAQAAAIVADVASALEQEMRSILMTHVMPSVQAGLAAQLRSGFQQLGQPSSGPGRPSRASGIGAPAGLSTAPVSTRLEERIPFLKGLTLSDEEIKAIARGVLLERKFEAVFRSGSDALTKLVASAKDASSPTAAFDSAKQLALTALTPTDDWERLYVAIGIEMLRAVGHKYIDSDQPAHGGALLNHAVSLVDFAEGTVHKIVSAICGLIPEVGAAGCAVIQEGVDVVWNGALMPGLEGVAARLVHAAWDGAINRVRNELRTTPSFDDVKTRLDNVDAFISSLPHEAALAAWAGDAVKKDKETIDNHLKAVRELVKEVRR